MLILTRVLAASGVAGPEPPAGASYWVLEEDGTSKWELEEGDGFWILEESS